MTDPAARGALDRASVPVRLFLTSATLLFVELLLIRWIAANVIYSGYFDNVVLMSSFLGIGVGILYGRARPAGPDRRLPFPRLRCSSCWSSP